MERIGFTTGSLYRSDVAFDDVIRLYHSLGATAIELSFATPTSLAAFELSPRLIDDTNKYSSISIHAPWKEVRYNSNTDTDAIIEKLKHLNARLPVNGIVLHPDTIDDFSRLERSDLPFLMENMDRRKSFGTHPEHFEKLRKDYNFGFVFDTEHAYEHDPNMDLAIELINVMGKRLKHMHVSGCSNSEIHVPTHISDNREAVIKILELRIEVPKILEGILLENISQTASEELNFVRNYEK